MSKVLQIPAVKRSSVGTGESRALRLKDKVPGIIYGEKKDPILITLDKKELKLAIQDAGFFSKQCEIKVDDNIFKVLPKDLQLHPVKENIVHIDFLRVGENTMVTLFVPVKFTNDNKCEGIKQGGVLNIVRHEVELKAPVSKIPEYLEADLSGLEIGDNIHISSIKLDADVSTIIKDRDFTIATIAPPTVMAIEEETKEEGEETVDEEGGEKTEESKDSSEQPEENKEKSQEKNKEDEKK